MGLYIRLFNVSMRNIRARQAPNYRRLTSTIMVGYRELHRVRIELDMNTFHGDYGQKKLRMFVDDYLISTASV